MIARRVALALALCTSLLAGCTYYQTAPGVSAPAPVSTFDRSWSAARNAMLEQGVRVNQEAQADGSVRVQFNTVGATTVDPQLIDRISSSYDRLMGR